MNEKTGKPKRVFDYFIQRMTLSGHCEYCGPYMYAHLNKDSNEYECRDLNCQGNNVPSWSGYCHECPKGYEPAIKKDRDGNPIMIPNPEVEGEMMEEKDYFC